MLQTCFRDDGILNSNKQADNKITSQTNLNNAIQVIDTLEHLARVFLDHSKAEDLSDVEVLISLFLQFLSYKPAGDYPAKAIEVKTEEN